MPQWQPRDPTLQLEQVAQVNHFNGFEFHGPFLLWDLSSVLFGTLLSYPNLRLRRFVKTVQAQEHRHKRGTNSTIKPTPPQYHSRISATTTRVVIGQQPLLVVEEATSSILLEHGQSVHSLSWCEAPPFGIRHGWRRPSNAHTLNGAGNNIGMELRASAFNLHEECAPQTRPLG